MKDLYRELSSGNIPHVRKAPERQAKSERLRIKSVPVLRWSLTRLLKGITEANAHGEVDTGNAAGSEVW